jgi:phage FluMu gp28-like protein
MWSYSPEAILQAASEWWGWKPHAAQHTWMMDTHPVKVAACGRRWGKTESLAVETAALALLYAGIRQVIVAPTLDQARILFDRTFELLHTYAEQRGLRMQVRNTPYPRIQVNNGEITARSAYRQAHSLRGRNAHRIVVDEAAYLSESVIPQVLLPMLADTEGQLVLLSTPFGRNHFWEWYQRGQSGEVCRSFHFPTASNPRISPMFLEMQRSLLTERQFAIEYEAQFVDDAGAVFPQAVIEACVDVRLAESTPTFGHSVAGLDWGRYRDFTALVVLREIDGRWRAVCVERMPSAGWQTQMERLLQRFQQWGVRTVCCDATGIGDPLAEMLQQALLERRMNIHLQPVVFTTFAKRMLIERLAMTMERAQVAIPPHPDLLRELHAFSARRAGSGHLRLQAAGTAHDDLVIALALAYHGVCCAAAPASGWQLLSSGRQREGSRCMY